MSLPPSVTPLVDALLTGVRNALGDNFAGFYLRGSLALGGFDPETSDLDILVLTERPLSTEDFAALAAVHERIPAGEYEFDHDYDLAYLDRELLRRHVPGQRYAKVGPGEPLHREDHRPNWVLERWTLREHGVVVAGPEPKTLIDPISAGDIRDAVRAELRERLRCWTEPVWNPDDLEHIGTQAFEVETVCRALYTLRFGEVSTKQAALTWALNTLPTRWHDLIRWAQESSGDMTKDGTHAPDALSFLTWAVEEPS